MMNLSKNYINIKKLQILLYTLITQSLCLQAIPINIDEASAEMLPQGSLRISLNGEDGVSYYLRNSGNLDEWNLVDGNPIQGTGNSATIDVNLDAPTEKKFFQMESRFERRARLFINNYNNQLTNGGPGILTIDGQPTQSEILIVEDRTNDQIVITANGIPNYTPTIMGLDVSNGWNSVMEGGFVSVKFSENNLGNANGAGNNPNSVVEAEEIFRIPLNPVYNEIPTDTTLGSVGVSVNGIPVYNPFEDQNETSAYGRIFSSCCGHPQRDGVYHYHKYPTCLRFIQGSTWQSEKEKCDTLDALLESDGHSPLIGFALDGWPIYGPVGWLNADRNSILLSTSYTGTVDSAGNPSYVSNSGNLDICNGITSPTPEFPEGIYHYVMSVRANEDGSVFRYINPHFGYDVRNTLKKHSVMPNSWENDSAYIGALQSGFTINQITIPGTNDYNTFAEFIEGMITRLNNNQLSAIADEFQTMQIEYPYTIRRYRGTPTTANNNGGDGTDTGTGTEINNRIQFVSPSSGSQGSSQTITIIFNGNTRPPLPPVNPNNVTVNGISLSNVTYNNSNSIVTGTLSLPNNATLGTGDVIVSFPTPNGTLSFISENSFSVTQ